MSYSQWFSVDRIFGNVAVLEDAEGNCLDVSLSELPEDISEGVRLQLVDGVYRVDKQATESRRQKILDLQNRLRNKNRT